MLRSTWLACLMGLAAFLVLVNLATDFARDVNYGWDVRVNCAAVEAHVGGLDPYFVKNLKGTKLSYPYLPVTLDVFRPLCAGGFLVAHYRGVYLVLAVLCALLLPGHGKTGGGLREVSVRVLCVLGAFIGFEWLAADGNFAIFSGLLTAVALALLLGGGHAEAQDDRRFLMRVIGAAVLGLVTSFKLVFWPVLAALYFLPLPRHRKFILIAVAAGGFALPILISMVFYADLFSSWLSAISGRIPEQHSIYQADSNQSLLRLASVVAEYVGVADSKLIVFTAYGLAATTLVLAPFAGCVLRAIRRQASPAEGSFLSSLDRWLMDHPHQAMRIAALSMYALYVASPRLKEYAFFELAVYAAVLIVDLSPLAMVAVLGSAVALPAIASILGNALVDSFGQAGAALVCFWILLLDFRASADLSAPGDESQRHRLPGDSDGPAPHRVVRAAGVEPAQRLRTEGF
jgi:hypothetical protein